MASEIKVDTISEKTSAAGVTVDGVLLKDSKIGGTITIPGSTGTMALTSDISAGGLEAAQIFRLTTNTNSDTFLKLWEAPDNTPAQGSIGSVVSVDTSTGYFSFSSTGLYLVQGSLIMFYHSNATISQQIIFTNDNFSSQTVFASKGFGAGYYQGPKDNNVVAILDIQDTTNDKFAINSLCSNTNNFVQGNTDQNMSTVSILKLGDT
jgi:hypothetical protein